jgi:hypothetical protein
MLARQLRLGATLVTAFGWSKQAKKRSLRTVNEHSEPVFNDAPATQVVFQRPVNARLTAAANPETGIYSASEPLGAKC